ncbi:hypothetical protein V2W30_00505 [Streptomyces sp. Q6]|uniref:Uncharacterized protein n=1 Tax=Streptomyces citrinus TaxID=3118173 RepID=A0ACD5A4S4_9ACTN
MTLHRTSTAQPMTAEEVAAVVRGVPGVAFLRPGLAGRLRSSVSRPTRAEQERGAGVRLILPDDGPWRVEIHVVVDRRARAVEVARAVRVRVEGQAAALLPERPAPEVTVTVTGRV